MELRWKPSTAATALHAAERLIYARPFVDQVIASALAEPGEQLAKEITLTPGLDRKFFLANLTALAAAISNNRELAELALTKTFGREKAKPHVAAFAGRISDVEIALNRAVPNLAVQLQLRIQPLREQWEARGPGLLFNVGRTTEPGILVSDAEVILLQPVAGGGGRAHIHFNTVRIEAILTNPHPQLPEVVRLAWMLSQLNLDLPDYQGVLTRDRTEVVGALALLPVVLSAGEEVELVRNDATTLAAAINGWECLDSVNMKERNVNEIANNLLVWWETYQSARPRWSVALAALDRMLV